MAANALMELKQDEALNIIDFLLSTMPENAEYHKLYYRAKGVPDIFDPSRASDALPLIRDLIKKQPNEGLTTLLRIHELRVVPTVEEFKELLSIFLIKQFEKCVPSVFAQIQPIYSNSAKVQAIQEVLEALKESLSTSKNYPNGTAAPTAMSLLWTLYVLSQHYIEVGDHKKALELINQAIDHTPTFIELYMVKAKVFKRQGAYTEAAVHMQKARSLDYSDRYLSNRASRYLLRAGKIKEGDTIMKSFIRDAGPESSIHELQVMWYEHALGEIYLQKEMYGPGIRQANFIYEHFENIEEDQFDFHSYCMRKYTLAAYAELMDRNANFRNFRYFGKAGYLALHGMKLYENYVAFKEKEEEEAMKKMGKTERSKARKQKAARETEDRITVDAEYVKGVDLYGETLLGELRTAPEKGPFKFAQRLTEARIPDETLNNWTMILCIDALKTHPLLAIKAFNKLRNPSNEQALLARLKIRKILEKGSDAEPVKKIIEDLKGKIQEPAKLLEESLKEGVCPVICNPSTYF
jgi:peptide alpha-N-acetyltransferase